MKKPSMLFRPDRLRRYALWVALEEMETLFAPFTQTASGIMRQEGTGLGLSISRAYAQLMGGDITVESRPGEGSAFTVTVRVTAVARPAATVAAPSYQSYEDVIGLAAGQGKIRLLVVDDNDANRLALQELLSGAGQQRRRRRCLTSA